MNVNNLFSELQRDQLIEIFIGTLPGKIYKILSIYSNGIKVSYEHNAVRDGEDILVEDILLIPYDSIKYIRLERK